jgi:hypothetical protein
LPEIARCRRLADAGARSRCFGSAELREARRRAGDPEDTLPPLITWRQAGATDSGQSNWGLVIGGVLVVGVVVCVIVEPCGAAVAGSLALGGAGTLATVP